MTQSFMRYLTINTNLTPAPTTGVTSKQVLLCGQRYTNRTIVNGASVPQADGTFIPSINGSPQPNYYEPIILPSFPNGVSALAYLKNYGLQYQMGIEFSQSLPAPDNVLQANSLTTLTWTTVPINFLQLVGFNLTGTLNQGAVNGKVYSAAIVAGVATLVLYGSVAIVTSGSSGAAMTLSGLNNIDYPDPILSDPICLMVWDFYQTALSAFNSPNGSPSCYISILKDNDTSITPANTSIVLGAPADVNISGTTTVLVYPATSENLGYLPTTTYGTTSVTQTTSNATGLYSGFTYDGTNINITITNVTGIFVIMDSVSVSLDQINAFFFLDNINLYASVLQFPVVTTTDITTTHSDFYDGIEFINEGNQVLNQHYFTYGIAGNITVLPNQAPTLPAPNNETLILVTYPYSAKFGDVPYENTAGNVASGRICSAVAYMLANGDAPYPSLTVATINHLPVSSVNSTTSYSQAQGGTGDLAVNQGWLPLAPNTNGVVAFLESNTTLITIPNTNVTDIEFRYTHIWDAVRWLKQNVAELYETISVLPFNQGTALLSPAFTRQFTQGILGVLQTGQNLGILENVQLYQNLVKVTQDQTNPNQVDAFIPCQIIPQLNGANVLINVFSSLYQFPNNQGA